jgi:hypothetical protein
VGRRSVVSRDCVRSGLIHCLLQWMWWRWRRKWGPASPFPADFLLALSTSTLSVAQGETSSAVSVTVTSEHGFSDAVETTLSSRPKGVSTNPASPFSVSPGQPVAVLFGADSGAATGQFAISAQATSGVLSHATSLSLTIQPGPLLNVPKSSFVRSDSVNSRRTQRALAVARVASRAVGDGFHGRRRTSRKFSDRRRIWAANVCGDHVGAHDRTTRQCSARDWRHCACIGCGGWRRQRHDSRQRVSVDDEGCAGWQASFCDVQGYEYPQYCYPRALARSPTACSRQSRWRIRRSQRRFFCAIISPNHSLAGFILVCENSMREGQCRHENSAIPI